MSIAVFLKNNIKNIPLSIGKVINRIPYSYRPGLGYVYRKRKKQIADFESYSSEQKHDFIFKKMKYIVDHAYSNIAFYKDYYDKSGFNPKELKSFKDINLIPIVNKDILNAYNLEKRSCNIKDRYVVNTGGSSGEPFQFYIEPSSMGHEWAHMHHIWGYLNYKPKDLKIVFNGNSNITNIIEYDAVRNHFAVDIFADYKLVSKKLKIILGKHKIKYLHGFPSSIYDFALFCKNEDNELRKMLSINLKGVFLGSEYPHLHYRNTIEHVFDVKTISWYGHTERSVLAYEKNNKFKFEPFHTYGFAESNKIDENNSELIATSYYNFASPLIRYNTNDIISNLELNDEIMTSFMILKGREGEFVVDKSKKKISLTGLIFGRHHEIFNYSKFIQVKQTSIGVIEIHFVSRDITEQKAESLFDSKNLNLDISFIKRKKPFRTISGKVNLLIK